MSEEPVPYQTHASKATFVEALAFAALKHRDQRRKDVEASPYINHPIALARVLVVEAGVDDEVVLAAALLHDTVEDTNTTYEELIEHFGRRIAAVVLEVTDDKLLEKADRKQMQIDHAPHMSPEAKLVKLADKICNIRDVASSPPTGWSLERRREYFDWAKKVIDALRSRPNGDVIGPVNPAWKLERLFDQAYARRP